MKKVRIKDIARQAGVSVGTVDRVIHNRGRVSTDVKRKVEEVMKEMGYRPNYLARTLASKKAFTIATLLPEPSSDSYWAQTWQGVQQAQIATQDFNVQLVPYPFDAQSVDSFLAASDQVLKSKLNAVLLVPLFLNEGYRIIKQCLENSLPVISVNTDIDFPGVLSYIGQNSFQAGKLAARLLDFGLQSDSTILLLTLDSSDIDGSHIIAKERGFRTYFQERKGKAIQMISKEFDPFEDKQSLRSFLKEQFDAYANITSIFVTNSRAHMVVDALSRKKLNKLNIVGFDLIAENLAYLRSGEINFLLNQNPYLQGYWGIMNLVRHLMNNAEIKTKQYLPLDVVMVENMEYYIERDISLKVIM